MAPEWGFGTRTIHAGEAPDPSTGAHGVPIYQNATYAFRSYDGMQSWREGAPHFLYAREGNPTVRTLELKLRDLEGAEDTLATASGMAAISATLLHLLRGGGHLVASSDLYAVTKEFLLQDAAVFGATVSWVDCTDVAVVEAAMTPDTRAIFTESFSNPLLRVVDVPALAQIAHRANAQLVVDNTFLSPALLRPLEHGADLVVQSATKYLSGHGNVLGGAVSGRRDTITALRGFLARLGGAMSPFSAWLLLTGVKTLPLRIDRHCTNAAMLARLLAAHPAVASVHYPGLVDHPQHDLAKQLVGNRFGGMVTFEFVDGEGAVRRFLDALTIPTIAVSLGDTATLIWPLTGTNQLRLSVGLEDPEDLEADIGGALDRARA